MRPALLRRIPPPPPWMLAGVALLVGGYFASGYVRAWLPGYGITKLLIVGRQFDERGIPAWQATPKYVDPFPAHQAGFDGQFYAEIALDPLLRDPALGRALDDPTYRPRRILLSWLAWLGGLGRPSWIINVYAALNFVFWVAYAVLAARLFRPHGWAGVAGYAAVLTTCGIVECMLSSLTDFPGFVLMLAAVLAGGNAGAAVLSLAALARETCLLGLSGLAVLAPPWREAWRKNFSRAVIAALPLVLWVGYVLWRFRDRELGVAGGNFEPPLQGIMEKLGELSVTLPHGPVRWHRWFFELYKSYTLHGLLTIVSLLTQCIYLVLHREWHNRLWRLAAVVVVYFLCIGYLSWEPHFTVTRHALPITFVFNLLLAARPGRGWTLWFVLGNAFVPFGLRFFIREVS